MSKILKWVAILFLLFTFVNIGVGIAQTQGTYELLWSYKTVSTVGEVSVSSGGNYVAAGSEDHKVYFFDKDGGLLWSYKTGDEVYGVSVSEDGNYVAAGSKDNKVYFFNKGGKLLWSHKTGGKVIHGVSVSADGNHVAVGSGDNKVYFFNREGKLLWSEGNYGSLYDASVSPDGNYVAAGDWGATWGWEALSRNNVYFFNKEGKLLWSYEAKTTGFSVSLSSNGNYVAAGSRSPDNKLYLFDKEGKLLWNYGVGNDIYSVSISSDGNYVAAGSNKAYLFNKEGKMVWNYNAGNKVYGVSVSSDGDYIAVGSDSKVYLFAKTKIIATNAVNEAKSTILSIKSKGFAVTDAESLLSQAENAFKSRDYKKAESFAESAKVKALKIDKVASDASSSISKAKSTLSQEKSKGFNIGKAESILFQAENAFNSGDYERARKLADESHSLVVDIDQDGVTNEKDFAPYISNYYIYAGIAVAFLIMAITTKVSLNIRRRNIEYEKKIEAYRAKVEQWKAEGYPVDELEEMLK